MMISARDDFQEGDDSRSWPQVVLRVSETMLPTRHGVFRALGYEDVLRRNQHLVLILGDPGDGRPVLVRFHSECLTGDVFGSRRCDCGEQLELAMQLIAREGRGVIIYLRGHEGRGIGLHNKLRAYQLQDRGLDTVEANEMLGFPADLRRYGPAAEILADLGVRSVRMLTNNPDKVVDLERHGMECVELVPLQIRANPNNSAYLETKRTKMGHLIDMNGHDRS